jgi:enamine deaminase RidA (YjgF/YER057c/UK114 family)
MRIEARLRELGLVLPAPTQPLELYGAEVGQHARSAVGLASLPFNIPVEIEAEVEID